MHRLWLTALLVLILVSCTTTEKLERYEATYTEVSSWMEDKGYSSVSTGTPEFFYDGRSWKDELIELIEASNDSILVSTFLGNEHFSTDEIWQALKAKADSGVAVYIIIDASSQVQEVPQSPERVKSALYMLKDMGMNVVEYNPYSISNGLFLPNLFDRDHRKYFVFDSHTVALGGININHTSLYYPGGRGHIDLMGVMESPELASLLSEAFVDTYNRYTPYPVELDELFTSRIGSDNGQDHTAYLFNHYYQTGSTIEELFDIFAVLPKKEIWFVQGYTFLTPRLLGRIEHLEAQGVDVNVILSENGSKDKYNKAALYNILPLIEAGATVYLYDAPDDAFLHQKAIVADGRYVTFGSANYNFRSETLSRELNLFYDDEKIAEDLMGFIEILLADARIISAEEAARWRGFSYWYLHMVMQVWG